MYNYFIILSIMEFKLYNLIILKSYQIGKIHKKGGNYEIHREV